MANKKRIEDKERILRYLIRKDSLCNSYKVARELNMERFEVLEILNELAREDKVRLRSGSVTAVTRELSEEEKVRTKSEVEELKESVERLEKKLELVFRLKEKMEKMEKRTDLTFNRLREAIPMGKKELKRESELKENNPDPEDIETQEGI